MVIRHQFTVQTEFAINIHEDQDWTFEFVVDEPTILAYVEPLRTAKIHDKRSQLLSRRHEELGCRIKNIEKTPNITVSFCFITFRN